LAVLLDRKLKAASLKSSTKLGKKKKEKRKKKKEKSIR